MCSSAQGVSFPLTNTISVWSNATLIALIYLEILLDNSEHVCKLLEKGVAHWFSPGNSGYTYKLLVREWHMVTLLSEIPATCNTLIFCRATEWSQSATLRAWKHFIVAFQEKHRFIHVQSLRGLGTCCRHEYISNKYKNHILTSMSWPRQARIHFKQIQQTYVYKHVMA